MVQAHSPSAGDGAKSPSQGGPLNEEIYTQDGDYIKDIEVNDLRNRYTLTKGSTQKMVNTHFLHKPTDTSSILPTSKDLTSVEHLHIFLTLGLSRKR